MNPAQKEQLSWTDFYRPTEKGYVPIEAMEKYRQEFFRGGLDGEETPKAHTNGV